VSEKHGVLAGMKDHLYPSTMHFGHLRGFWMHEKWVFLEVKTSKMGNKNTISGKGITILGKKFIMGIRYRAWCEA
jgi:hypothetical protein